MVIIVETYKFLIWIVRVFDVHIAFSNNDNCYFVKDVH